ncbi:hypothetical protein KB553_09685 [Chryseobacterium rhizoplanae]|uniref:Dps family protein n=1 Tax=Chryseobacterium rhizoplanae TaxID=1609531 RepID=UPI001CE38FD8|nr:ferritin-like domain-containing protein [Chryseobacterium rhizoplanae]UCA61782.1 hypothetical protein KB553_09685 [Chryseobacterium rhizoplanae]
MKIQIGIGNKHRQAVADELMKILADENILYTKTKNAYWNIEGSDFYDKHIFFETQSEQLNKIIDSIAERIRSVGHLVSATLQPYITISHLREQKKRKTTARLLLRICWRIMKSSSLY